MEYRGRNYSVVQGIEPHVWKWTVDVENGVSKSGEAKTRASALIAVVMLIDKMSATKSPIESIE